MEAGAEQVFVCQVAEDVAAAEAVQTAHRVPVKIAIVLELIHPSIL